jgi:hypothetical protein
MEPDVMAVLNDRDDQRATEDEPDREGPPESEAVTAWLVLAPVDELAPDHRPDLVSEL